MGLDVVQVEPFTFNAVHPLLTSESSLEKLGLDSILIVGVYVTLLRKIIILIVLVDDLLPDSLLDLQHFLNELSDFLFADVFIVILVELHEELLKLSLLEDTRNVVFISE